MTKVQLEFHKRPAPANDFVTLPVTLTREEWRYIEQTADKRRNGGSQGESALRSAAWEKLYRQINDL
jgi:hypothetical protein